jgi:sugar phosphate isomerase/epimerase
MVPFAYCYDWGVFEEKGRQVAMAEFAANGVKHIVLTSTLIEMISGNPKLYLKLQTEARDAGLTFVDSHMPFNYETDIALPVAEYRPQMLARMKFNLELIHDYGVDTCCFHICSHYYKEIPMARHMDAARSSLEELLPVAEELGIVICLENIFQPCNTVDDVLTLIGEFPSPYLGACFDIGHAHLMEQGMHVPNCIVPTHWEGVCPVPWEKNVLDRMLPHIVDCHLHDNSADLDTHTIPGMGTIDWAPAMAKLRTAPRLKNMQSEVIPVRRNGIPIRRVVESFDRLLK